MGGTPPRITWKMILGRLLENNAKMPPCPERDLWLAVLMGGVEGAVAYVKYGKRQPKTQAQKTTKEDGLSRHYDDYLFIKEPSRHKNHCFIVGVNQGWFRRVSRRILAAAEAGTL